MFKPYPTEAKVARAKHVGNVQLVLHGFNPAMQAPVRDPATGRAQVDAEGAIVTHPVQAILAGAIEMLDEQGALYDRVQIDAAGGMTPKVAKAAAAFMAAVLDAFFEAHPDLERTVPPKHASRITPVERGVARESERMKKRKAAREAHEARVRDALERRAAATGAARDGIDQNPESQNPNR